MRGTDTITVAQGTYRANASFVVTAALGLSPDEGVVGTTGTVAGSGWLASTAYSVDWNGSTILCTGSTNSTGEFSCPYTIPAAPAGPHAITVTQKGSSLGEDFSVAPQIALSAPNATVGASVIVSGTGFDASMHYTVNWGTTTTLCSGTTNTNGELRCAFLIPPSLAGPGSITVLEGAYALTSPFTVTPSSPASPSSSTPFPWWVVAVVAFAAAALLVVGLLYEHRRHHRPRARPQPSRSAGPVQPWEENVGAPAATLSAPLAVSATMGAPGAEEAGPGGGGAVAPTAGEPADIDVLIARLEKMSMEMFKKTPKQLGEQGFEEESPKASEKS